MQGLAQVNLTIDSLTTPEISYVITNLKTLPEETPIANLTEPLLTGVNGITVALKEITIKTQGEVSVL